MKLLYDINFFLHCSKHANPSITNQFTRQLTTTSSFPPRRTTIESQCNKGHLQQALLEMAIQGTEMRFDGYNTLLNECVNRRAIREGQRVHSHMIKTCYLPSVYLRTRLIVLYTKCKRLSDARHVFDGMRDRNVVPWTAMISGYSQWGFASEALHLFVQMLRSGTSSSCPDKIMKILSY